MNKAILVGGLTQEPELKESNGTKFVNFSLATTEFNKGDKTSEYHNCTVFGKTAESLSQYGFKGQKIAVDGKLQTRNWEKDGVKHYKTSVIVWNLEMLSFKDSEKQNNSKPQVKEEVINIEDVPFR